MYVLVALPLAGGAVALRQHREAAVGDGARELKPTFTAYWRSARVICAQENEIAARAPKAPEEPRELAAWLNARLAELEPYERRFRALHPPPLEADVHARLVETNLRAMKSLREVGAALARRDLDKARDSYAAVRVAGESYDRAAASIGLVDCIAPPEHDPKLGYPAAPQHAGRTELSWRAFRRAIDGVCADNVARTRWGQRLIRTSALLSRSRRNGAYWALLQTSYRRLEQLIHRIGRPPAENARYDAWLSKVTQRRKAVYRQARAAGRRDRAEVERLQAEIERLNAEENFLAKRWGLRVCSANGPVAPPRRAPSLPREPSIAA